MPKKSRRKNKKRKSRTRKKRGGNTERDAYIYRLIEPLVLGLQDQIDELGVRADAIENDRDALEERIEALERQRSGTGGTGGGKRKKKTRKKRGGVERWTRETLQPNPETFDDIGYFYDCKPMPMIGSTNKSKYRENMIITGDRDGNQLMLPHKLKIIRMNDSQTYDPQLQLVDMREREGLRGMAAFHRRAQDLCNRGYKPWERNDAKTGAGRKKKTRKKRGGVRRRRQYHPLETLASNDMLELFRNTVTREFVPTAMDLCRSDHTKRCLSEHLIAQRLPHNKNEFTQEQLDTYYDIIQICKPNIAVPWNIQSGEGQGGGSRKKKTRKKRGAVKFGKNKTTAEIVKEGRKILQTTPQKKKRQIREQQIKLTGEKEFALFKKQAMDKMKIAFYKSFKKLPNDNDRKMLSLVYKSLKQPLNKQEEKIIQDYRAENNENKRKFVWMNNSLIQLRDESVKRKHQIYNTGDDPDVIKKYRPRERQRKMGPASGLVVNTNKYMSPVKGPDTRYPKLSLDIGERSNKKLFGGGRKKRRRRKKNKR